MEHEANLSLTEADLNGLWAWHPELRARCIKVTFRDFGETNDRAHVWEPRRHELDDPRWMICRRPSGLWLYDYDTGDSQGRWRQSTRARLGSP